MGEARWLRISLRLLKLSLFRFSKPCSLELCYRRVIEKEIHEELFSAVAAVLAFIFRIANGENLEAPEIEVPEDFNSMKQRTLQCLDYRIRNQ